jgi:hypothetical protein
VFVVVLVGVDGLLEYTDNHQALLYPQCPEITCGGRADGSRPTEYRVGSAVKSGAASHSIFRPNHRISKMQFISAFLLRLKGVEKSLSSDWTEVNFSQRNSRIQWRLLNCRSRCVVELLGLIILPRVDCDGFCCFYTTYIYELYI